MRELKSIESLNKAIDADLTMIVAKSHTCTVCHSITDILEHNVSNIGDVDAYTIYIDDVDEFRGQHTIFSVPTVLLFSNGKELLRESRYINYGKIERLIHLYKN